ncbi:hypothetical protein ACFLWR_06425 [Chloroflexota bacterium]
MKIHLENNRLLVMILLFFVIFSPIITAGCQEEVTQPTKTLTRGELSMTRVPNIDFDLYVYSKQENPTTVPTRILGTSIDVDVESLALWGVPTEDTIILGGSLTFIDAVDAGEMHIRINQQDEIWTKLSDRSIYFVIGSGAVADTMKAAISENNFTNYDNQDALREVGLLPDVGTTKLAALGIVIPSETLSGLLIKQISQEYSSIVNTLMTQAQLQVVAAGLFAPQHIDIDEIMQKIERNSIWEADLGILAVIKSGLPGFIVSPIVKSILINAGYIETTINELAIYKSKIDTENGEVIPIFISIEENRIYVALSGQEAYAQKLITNISR